MPGKFTHADSARAAGLPAARSFASHVSTALWVSSAVLGLGTLVDVGSLWVAQRQPTPQWEFMASTSSLDAIPALALSVALAFAALYLQQVDRPAGYRLLAALLLLLGVLSGVLGGLLGTSYLVLERSVDASTLAPLRSSAWKSGLLSVLFVVLLLPGGILGVLRSSDNRS